MLLKCSKCCQAAGRLLIHLIVCVAVLVAFGMVFGSTASAAGCSHRFENAMQSLDPYGKPLANNVRKIYSGGEFQYYVLPVGEPCKGPNCKGAPPTNLAAIPPVIANDRCDLTLLTNSSIVGQSHFCGSSRLCLTMRPISQVQDGLLRPPTTSLHSQA